MCLFHSHGEYERLQFLEVWRSQTSNWVPPLRRAPMGIWNDTASAIVRRALLSIESRTPNGFTLGDIVESLESNGVQERVQEAHATLPSAEARIVEQSHDTTPKWCCGGRAT